MPIIFLGSYTFHQYWINNWNYLTSILNSVEAANLLHHISEGNNYTASQLLAIKLEGHLCEYNQRSKSKGWQLIWGSKKITEEEVKLIEFLEDFKRNHDGEKWSTTIEKCSLEG